MGKTHYNRISWIVFSMILLNTKAIGNDLTLEMIFRYNLFNANRVTGIQSTKDGLDYYQLEDSRYIIKYSYETGEIIDTLFSLINLEEPEFNTLSSFEINEDENVILLGTEKEKIYRYSYLTTYYIYDKINGKISPLFSEGKQRLAELSPDGQKVAFVYENNLYLKDIRAGKVTQITNDGMRNQIINGAPDWLYEEEFHLLKGFYWSADSRKLAYYHFDESKVREYSLTFYGDVYPELYTYKYPKAGSTNPKVDVCIFDLISGISKTMNVASDSDSYLPRIKWLPISSRLCIITLNRLQNKADIYLCDAESGNSQHFYTEQNEKYISDIDDTFITFSDSEKAVIIRSDRDGYRHLYHYTLDGRLIGQITQGNWEVDEFYGYDEDSGRLFYTSTEISPLERHLYSINIDGTSKKQLTTESGTHSASFNSTFQYYVLASSDAQTPYLFRLFDSQGNLIRTLENNVILQYLTKEYAFSRKEFFTFRSHDSTDLYAYRILPPGFRKNRKYPVLIYVYGGPESQSVTDSWENRLAWFQLLAQKGYIIICADNRGTDGRGEAFRKPIYMQLGKLELDDQLALTEYLTDQKYIDKNRIGIFGWSYGGYMVLNSLTHGNGIYKTGIAVAPVTDWRFYDTAYTERYMRKPSENEESYFTGSPLNFIDNLEGNLLLIHGLADDNVHFQNSAELITRVKEADKNIDMYIYPNENHSMRGPNSLYHVYSIITEYILINL